MASSRWRPFTETQASKSGFERKPNSMTALGMSLPGTSGWSFSQASNFSLWWTFFSTFLAEDGGELLLERLLVASLVLRVDRDGNAIGGGARCAVVVEREEEVGLGLLGEVRPRAEFRGAVAVTGGDLAVVTAGHVYTRAGVLQVVEELPPRRAC